MSNATITFKKKEAARQYGAITPFNRVPGFDKLEEQAKVQREKEKAWKSRKRKS